MRPFNPAHIAEEIASETNWVNAFVEVLEELDLPGTEYPEGLAELYQRIGARITEGRWVPNQNLEEIVVMYVAAILFGYPAHLRREQCNDVDTIKKFNEIAEKRIRARLPGFKIVQVTMSPFSDKVIINNKLIRQGDPLNPIAQITRRIVLDLAEDQSLWMVEK